MRPRASFRTLCRRRWASRSKAARAEPDGYTILLHQDALAAGMTLYLNRTFDAEKDFVPIGLVNTTAITLAGPPTLPPNNRASVQATSNAASTVG